MNDPQPISVEEATAVLRGVNEGRVSLLQRRFLLGYQSALDLMDRVNLALQVDHPGTDERGVAKSTTTCRPDLENVRGLVAVVREALGAKRLVELTGATLYSEPHTVAPGAVYLLGTNPGGDSEGKPPIGQLLDRLEQGESSGNDYYDDESWDTPQSRQLQGTIRAILDVVAPGEQRNVCASNVVFVRSRTVKDLEEKTEGFWQLAEACWPCHAYLLELIRPKLLVTYGNGAGSAYDFVTHKLRQHTRGDVVSEPSDCGKTLLFKRTVDLGWGEVRIVGLPHPSRFKLLEGSGNTNPNSEQPKLKPNVAKFIRSATLAHDN